MKDITIAKINVSDLKLTAFKRVINDAVIYRLEDYTFDGVADVKDYDTERELALAFRNRVSL